VGHFSFHIFWDAVFLPNLTPLLSCRHGRSQGEQNGHLPALEIEPKNQNFLENMKSKSLAQFRLNDLILGMTVFLPVRYSHCTRARFTVLVSCSRELAVHLGSIGWPNLGADSTAVGFYCVITTWVTSICDSRRFAASCCLLLI